MSSLLKAIPAAVTELELGLGHHPALPLQRAQGHCDPWQEGCNSPWVVLLLSPQSPLRREAREQRAQDDRPCPRQRCFAALFPRGTLRASQALLPHLLCSLSSLYHSSFVHSSFRAIPTSVPSPNHCICLNILGILMSFRTNELGPPGPNWSLGCLLINWYKALGERGGGRRGGRERRLVPEKT